MGIVIDEWPLLVARTRGVGASRLPDPRSLAPSGEKQELDIVCAEGIAAMFMGIDIVFRLKARAKEILSALVATCTQSIFETDVCTV